MADLDQTREISVCSGEGRHDCWHGDEGAICLRQLLATVVDFHVWAVANLKSADNGKDYCVKAKIKARLIGDNDPDE